MTPTLPTARASLPPDGAVPHKGGLSGELAAALVVARACDGVLPFAGRGRQA